MTENNKKNKTAQTSASRYEMRKVVEQKSDGRSLIYYSFLPKGASCQADGHATVKPAQQKKAQS
jgi:hypothetical protein